MQNDPYLNSTKNQEMLKNLYTGGSIAPPTEENKYDMVKEQKQTNTVPFNNNVVIKRDSIKLEKDSINKDIFYFSFAYQAFSNINLTIFLNAKVDYNNDSVISEFPARTRDIPQSHIKTPNTNQFTNFKEEKVEGLLVNMEEYKTFLQNNVFVDINSFYSHKNYDASLIDVLFVFDFLSNSRLFMFFKLILTTVDGLSIKVFDPNIKNTKVSLKYVCQKLKHFDYWYDMHDIYGLASKNEGE